MSAPFRVGIVSDTHGHLRNTQKAVEMLQDENVSHIIHCGDIGGAAIIQLFSNWSTYYVFGNNDRQEDHLRATIQGLGQTCCGKSGELQLGQTRIGFTHGHKKKRMNQMLKEDAYDIVCSGHTHKASLESANDKILLNPGALYRATPLSFAVIDISDEINVRFHEVPKKD